MWQQEPICVEVAGAGLLHKFQTEQLQSARRLPGSMDVARHPAGHSSSEQLSPTTGYSSDIDVVHDLVPISEPGACRASED